MTPADLPALEPAAPASLPAPRRPRAEVLRAMPRRTPLVSVQHDQPPVRMTGPDIPRGGAGLFARRSARWVAAAAHLVAGTAWDRLRGDTTVEQRARRLRTMFEDIGGTAIKVGQQLSMRIDLLPFEVCNELSKMLDKVAPFPTDQALAVIERSMRRPIEEVFDAFDPTPIGSASVACVFQAQLRTGERVAVKVRRPDILQVFHADLSILESLLTLAELSTLVRPGQFQYLRREVRSMLMEELSFTAEARYQTLFRDAAERDRLRWVSAPRVHLDLSGDEVLVSEFVSGVWCWEVLAACESGDPAARAMLQEFDIDPRLVGERLFKSSLWGNFECLFFHADPHPGNIVIQPGNKLMFIDFGACGTSSARMRELNLELIACREYDDAEGMARCLMRMLEPLPHINTYELEKRMESLAWGHLFAVNDPSARWWERATASLWIAFMSLAREYALPVNPDTVRNMRATFLYDTLAARLHPTIDPVKVWRKWQRKAVDRANRRARKRVRRRLRRDGNRSILAAADDALRQGELLRFDFRRAREQIPFRREAVVGKLSYFFVTILNGLLGLAVVIAGLAIASLPFLDDPAAVEAMKRTILSPWLILLVATIAIITLRRLLYRFGDKDDDRD
jgi:ubiquinone biosynthesis protein